MNQNFYFLRIVIVLAVFISFPLIPFAGALQNYNVIWNSPSKDHNGSMPIGNGDIGLNVWAEPDGELVLLMSKSDAWSENARLLKLGRVRITFDPNFFQDEFTFKQILNLQHGEIEIEAGKQDTTLTIRIWVDANRPAIHVQTEGSKSYNLKADLDIWRTQKREVTGAELHSAYGLHNAPFPVYVYPDIVAENAESQIVWYHRNEHSIWENNLRHQGLEPFIETHNDPLLNRTFGGSMQGKGLVKISHTALRSKTSQKRFQLSIYPYTNQTKSVASWRQQLDSSIEAIQRVDIAEALSNHRGWWKEFWNRSWIFASGTPDAEAVTRGYVLQRWINACAGRGAYPIKFNGSLFTVDGAGYDADYRRWGGPYWWQNTRLPYWPMLASGDFDMMQPLFRMYQAMIPLQEFRTKTWFGHEGSFIGETVYFWGMYTNENYGWQRSDTMPAGILTNRYIRREYTSSLELLAMMLDYYAYTQDDTFLHEQLLPMSDSLLFFWDRHYKLDQHGRLFLYPAQSLETLQDAMNPTTDIAGLHWVLDHLLKLKPDRTGNERREFWNKLKQKVPELPLENDDSKTYIIGAEKYFGGRGNSENPELYAVFPFRLYGVNKPDRGIGVETFHRRTVKGHVGWRQDDTQAAFLGLTDMAKELLTERAKTKHDQSRFPAFWGPNFDWVPDQDHGGNLMKAFQTMLLQADDGNILLMPAWPKEWNVDFKLHAPNRTVLEGKIQHGNVLNLTVTPSQRKDDVIIVKNP